MAIIIMHHEVKDYAAWKPHYDGDAPRRENAGFKEVAVGTHSEKPNRVYMIWEGDPANIEPMLKDPELAEKMKEAGVISKPEAIVINT